MNTTCTVTDALLPLFHKMQHTVHTWCEFFYTVSIHGDVNIGTIPHALLSPHKSCSYYSIQHTDHTRCESDSIATSMSIHGDVNTGSVLQYSRPVCSLPARLTHSLTVRCTTAYLSPLAVYEASHGEKNAPGSVGGLRCVCAFWSRVRFCKVQVSIRPCHIYIFQCLSVPP